MGVKLKCNCEVTDDGKFVVSKQCVYCAECNTVSGLHPFGNRRLA